MLKMHVEVQYIIERHLLERVIIGKFNSKSAVKVLIFADIGKFSGKKMRIFFIFLPIYASVLSELPIIKIRVRQMDRKSQTALLRRKRQSMIKLLCNKCNGCASSSSHRFQICGSPKKECDHCLRSPHRTHSVSARRGPQ